MPKTRPFKENHQRYEKWFVENELLYDAELAAVKEFVPKEGAGLEIGVGSGLFSKPLGICFGVDPCGEMLDLAQKRDVKVMRGVAEALPCKSVKFDYILMVTVVCFFDDPLKAFQEVKRVLAPGGRLIIAYIDCASPMGQEYEKHQSESTFYKEARFFSTREMVEMLTEAGFKQFSFRQCISSAGEDKEVFTVQQGYGQGGFVVVEAK